MRAAVLEKTESLVVPAADYDHVRRALAFMTEQWRRQPSLDEVAAHLGEVLWVMGDRSAATRVWRGALATQPDSVHLRDTMQRLDPAA